MNQIERVLQKLRIKPSKIDTKSNRIWALCPYHDDEHPSWFIRISGQFKGRHFCFSCKQGGNLPQLAAHRLNISYAVAQEWLEKDGEEEPPVTGLIFQLSQLSNPGFELPREVRFKPLQAWPSLLRSYAIKRGITQAQVERWRIGYAVEGKLALRIVFITYSKEWQPLRYSARTVVNSPRRYLEATDQEHADRSALFGETHWPDNRSTVVVTEGAINALAVERVCPDYAIAALSGSKPSLRHFAKLATFKRIILLLDNDVAGRQASQSLKSGIGRWTETIPIFLPHGKDPASLQAGELHHFLHESGAIPRGDEERSSLVLL